MIQSGDIVKVNNRLAKFHGRKNGMALVTFSGEGKTTWCEMESVELARKTEVDIQFNGWDGLLDRLRR